MTEIADNRIKEHSLENKKTTVVDLSGQIISSVSHELRNPLAILSSNIELLKHMKFTADGKIMDETFYLCEEALKAMTRFVDDISLLNSFNKNNRKAQYEEFVLGELFQEIIQQFPEHNRGRVLLVTNHEAARFCTDPFLLSVILKNLIGNALKFSSEQVVLKAECRNKELNVRIEDSGIGIPQDETGRVFEPFYRGSNVKLMSGSGLGLAIVKRSMDLLNGTVEVHSLIDHGTTFNIKIRNNGC